MERFCPGPNIIEYEELTPPMYDVVELVSQTVIRPNVSLVAAYRVRDQHQAAMLRAGRTLTRKRYSVRLSTEPKKAA